MDAWPACTIARRSRYGSGAYSIRSSLACLSRQTQGKPHSPPRTGLSMSSLKLSRLPSGEPEIFASIQGEGVSLGMPSTFIRLSLCNLACGWCDTKYTWDWSNHDPGVEIVQVECSDIVARVDQLGVTNVVITGGEPLMQQGPLSDLTAELYRRGHRIEVETNGTLTPNEAVRSHVAQWNVSPKLANSGNSRARRLIDRPLGWFATSSSAWFKFVIEAPSDLSEVESLQTRFSVPSERVILMPQGISKGELRDHSSWLAEQCSKRGYRFSTRLQILLWGDERGR